MLRRDHYYAITFSFRFHPRRLFLFFFFFNDTATTEIYTLSLHDALPIFELRRKTSSVRTAKISWLCSVARFLYFPSPHGDPQPYLFRRGSHKALAQPPRRSSRIPLILLP